MNIRFNSYIFIRAWLARSVWTIIIFILTGNLFKVYAQATTVPENPAPDMRFKSDILLVLAHPDDETAIGSFLAKLIYDDQKRIAVIYLNRGNGGGNSIGNEQSMALADIREVEVRQALARFNIFSVWILEGKDTPGQDLFHSLENTGHGAALERVIRLVRLTRPEIIVTWMPIYVSGENHGDHQAAGVIATEAFDLAGDPTVFPTQVVIPRDRLDINNFQEGLHPWQSKKIYYFSDREEELIAPGPHFDMTAISKVKGVPYSRLAAELHTPHQVQAEVSTIAETAIKTGDFTEFNHWLSRYHLIFGKSIVPCSTSGDIFEGIDSSEHSYVRASGYSPDQQTGIHLETGGVFKFYRQFWKVHDINHLKTLITPEVMVASGSYVHLPLLICNYTDKPIEVNLSSQLPVGWQHYSGIGRYKVAAGEDCPAQTLVQAPYETTKKPVMIRWNIEMNGISIDSVNFKVDLRYWTLPQ